MPTARAPRRTTDLPVQQAPRPGIDLAATAVRYAALFRLGYLACIGIATLLQLGFDAAPYNVSARFQRALHPPMSFRDIIDGARNIALFLGWGAVWVLTSPAPSRWRDVVRATVLGGLASLTVESMQLFSLHRMASVADLTTNTLGSLLGAVTFWLVEQRAMTDMRRGTLLGVPGWLPAGALVLTGAGLAFAPSGRVAMTIAWLPTPMGRARMIWNFPAASVTWVGVLSDVAVWLAVGLTVAIAISDRTGRVRLRQLAAWLLIVPAMLLSAHLGRAMAGLQREELTLVLQGGSAAIGLATGLLLVPSWRTRVTARTTRALQLGLLVTALGAIMAWTPATWVVTAANRPALSWNQLIPMMSLFQRQDLSSVFLVLQKAGAGAALGACLAARKRNGAPSPGLRAAALVAILWEVGQLLSPGRYPDITDVIIVAAAAGLAAVLVARADLGARQQDAPPPGLERPRPSR